MKNLKNKKILITAGPTWVAIDNVRVISNIATGETGKLLTEKLQQLGARVTLVLGPVGSRCLSKKIKLLNFKFFAELSSILIKELKTKRYDYFIHTAAVSDYQLEKIYQHKVKSGIRNWKINLKPTTKLIEMVKRIDRSVFTVAFKFQPEAKKDRLIAEARKLLFNADLNLVVANSLAGGKYCAYIIDNGDQICGPLRDKENLTEKLIKIIRENPCKN